jgi:hypothetical protein
MLAFLFSTLTASNNDGDESKSSKQTIATAMEMALTPDSSCEEMKPSSSSDAPSISMMDESGWQWIMTASEVLTKDFVAKRAELRQAELRSVQGESSSFSWRTEIAEQVERIWSGTTNNDDDGAKHECEQLDASKRSALCSDLVDQFAHCWAVTCVSMLGGDEQRVRRFNDIFVEGRYEKGVIGALKSVAFHASHGAGGALTRRVCVDVCSMLFHTLQRVLKDLLERPLDTDESTLLVAQIMLAVPVLRVLWQTTAAVSALGRRNEGAVARRFEARDREHRAYLQHLKDANLVDARFVEPSAFDQAQVSALVSADHTANLNGFLTQALQMRRPNPSPGL